MRWIAFVVAAVVIFTVFVSVYAASAQRAEVRLLPKWLWVLLCIFLPPIGGLLYLVVGRPLGSSGPSGPRSGRRTRTVAPDDDPEFLRDLAEKLKRDEAPTDSGGASDVSGKAGDKDAGKATDRTDADPDAKPDEEPKP